jgi:competence protein ComEA
MKSNQITSLGLKAFLLLGILSGQGLVFQSGWVHAAPKSMVEVSSEIIPVNINKAGVEELQAIRGIGPSLAERIVDYRNEYGLFVSTDDLAQVRGIGGTRLQKIKGQIAV